MATPFIEYTHTDGDTSKFEFSNSITCEDFQKFHPLKKPALHLEYTDENDVKSRLELNDSTKHEDLVAFYETYTKKHDPCA